MNLRSWAAAIAVSFLLGIQDGYIALWKDGIEKPVEVFPFRASMLPEADRSRLEKGIRVEGPEELAQLMEDYLS